MRVRTLFLYLLGNRRAIREIAAERSALWLGLLLVISATCAREYSTDRWMLQPWRLVAPLGASLLASLLLFALSALVVVCRGEAASSIFPAFPFFLGLFWMTAPLAWLYAVPYARFLGPADAERANLWTLGLVSAWRVCLMMRVLYVVMDFHPAAAVCCVMLVADSLALLLLFVVGFPIIRFMGHLGLSEAGEVGNAVACDVLRLGGCSLPLWLVGTLALSRLGQPAWQVSPRVGTGPSRPLVVLVVASVAVGTLAVLFTLG